MSRLLLPAAMAIAASLLALPVRADKPEAGRAEAIAPLRLDYTIYAGGLRALAMRVRVATRPPAYRVQVQVRTTGFLADLLSFVLAARTDGRRAAGGWRPERYVTANRWRDRDVRRVAIRYGDSPQPAVAAVPPPKKDDRGIVPPAERRGTVDPLTGVFALFLARESGCAGTAEIFDGRRRFDVTAATDGTRQVETEGYGIYSGEAAVCRLSVETIAGFWNRFDERKRYPDAVRVDLARAVEGAPPVPVRFQMDTGYAPVVGHLTGTARGDAAGLPDTGLRVLEGAPSPAGDR